MTDSDFFVIVAAFNEQRAIRATLQRLAAQTDRRFSLVVVNNASTDHTAAVVEAFAGRNPTLPVHLIREPQKGTGAAADTGCRYAISRGARYLARTDADCLPDRRWIAAIKRAFCQEGLEFVIGRMAMRTDDTRVTALDRAILPWMWTFGEAAGHVVNRGKGMQYRFIAVAGSNMALTSDLYLRAGGFPRTRIEQAHEDLIIAERIRALTPRARKCDDVVVYASIRRVKHYGYWNTLMWYWDHRFSPQEVDIR
jgi:glycosyltransferase involved in cell wall biosynthesis